LQIAESRVQGCRIRQSFGARAPAGIIRALPTLRIHIIKAHGKEPDMRRIAIIVLGTLIGVPLFPALAYAQEPTPPPAINPANVAAGFGDPSFWVSLLATLIAGALGGVVYELLILQGSIELPHRVTDEEIRERPEYAITKNLVDLGIWSRVIIGALAAVAALLVLSPSTTFGLVATALVAGSAGTSVFRSLQDRLSVVTAQKDAAAIRARATMQNAKVAEAMAAWTELKKKMVEASVSPAGSRDLAFAPAEGAPVTPALSLDDLDRVERLLSEAKGIHEGM